MDMMSRSPTFACWRAIIGLSSSSNAYSMPARNFAENSSLSGWMSRPKAQKYSVVPGDPAAITRSVEEQMFDYQSQLVLSITLFHWNKKMLQISEETNTS